jgi:5-methyltetrahydropteroyltriglutamate--homocysteine methyltransferase
LPANYRADQVGSFLRPREVLEAHDKQAKGELSEQQVRDIEDRAILQVLEMQRQTGIEVLSDGEFRRSTWAGEFSESVEGYVPGRPSVTVFGGAPAQAPAAAAPAASSGMPAVGRLGGMRVIGEKLRPKRRLAAFEAPFMEQHAAGKPFKITMPACTYVVARGYNPEITSKAYPTRFDVLKDAAAIINTEIKTLVGEGVPYVQLDNPHYPDYVVDERREAWRAVGVDPDKALLEDIEADNLCLRGFDRSNVTLAMHLCRGNGGRGPNEPAGWHTEGSYERIAEALFGGLEVDRFLLEYDSSRAGGFEPLRFMPKGKQVVLGLVTTKVGQLETEDELRRRIDEAAKYVDLADLALSPQCGFASTAPGNPLTQDEQRRKLELVVETARKVWGS